MTMTLVFDMAAAHEKRRQHELAERCAEFAHDDVGLAERFVLRNATDVFYAEGRGWFCWDGRRWDHDREEHEIRLRAQQTARAVVDEIPLAGDARTQQARWTFSRRACGSARLTAMLKEAQPRMVERRPLDAHAELLCVANGTVNLRTGALLPHERTHLITRISEIGYQPDAECRTFETFLETVLPDASVREFFARFVGYSLTGDTGEQKLLFLYGSGGNGKSVAVECVKLALGEYSMVLPFSSLCVDDRRRGGEASPDLARMPGMRMVVASEPEAGAKLGESLVKSLTGQDTITARHLYGSFFDFVPTHKLWLTGNHRPQIRGQDDGIWRRILLLPFPVTIPKEQRDAALPQRLAAEAPGILAWAVRGATRWFESGLAVPKAVQAATEDYRTASDPLANFMACALDIAPTLRVQSSRLHAAYEIWVRENGGEGMSQKRFSTLIAERGFTKETAGVVVWKGLTLKPDWHRRV